MSFAEKLIFLMKLTSTSNKQLAEAVNVDPSLISLFRTSRRGLPKNIAHTRAMANYFARRCEGNYQRMALCEAMGRKYLPTMIGTDQLSDVLLDWFVDSRDQVGQLLNTFERFSFVDPVATGMGAVNNAAAVNAASNFTFYGNEGKRAALNMFITQMQSQPTPGTVLLASDENFEWLFEDQSFHTHLREQLKLIIQKGFRICRVAAPFYSADQAFDSLDRWLSLYMSGQVESYYYPRLRDELYRRTLIVLPGVAAFVSTSIGVQSHCRATLLTLDQRLITAFAGEFNDLRTRCRPMMISYSTAGSADGLARCISQFESDKGDRIQQSTTLSSITTPTELLLQVTSSCPPDEAAAITTTLSKAQTAFVQSLLQYEAVDIHSLAAEEDVRAGLVPISVSYLHQDGLSYYTPDTYVMHLRNILSYMEQYENYCAVLRPRQADNHALLVKEKRQALLLRPDVPLTVFEITQPYIAEACREYLLHLSAPITSPQKQRRETAALLHQMIERLQR